MPRLLIIAYYYPPLGGVGAQRPLKFTRYLPEFNWQPIVLSVNVRADSQQDFSLELSHSMSTPVVRTKACILPERIPWRLRYLISRYVLLVDEQIGWFPFAINAARQIIAKQDIHAVLSTSPPYTTHLIGQKIKRSFHLPWIADFRDPWVGNFSISHPSAWHAQFNAHLEKSVVINADRVITVSEPMREAFAQRYPDQAPTKFCTIPNGFDPAGFSNVTAADRPIDCFILVYTGSFYGQKQTPHAFLRSLRLAIDQNLIPINHFQVHFIGSANPYLKEEIETLSLQQVTRVFGFLPHSQTTAHLLSADMALLIIGSGPGSETVVTGKIYEYLASRKPILALVPAGAAADLVNEAKAGIVVPPDDIPAIAAQLGNAYRLWQQGQLSITPNDQVIARFDCRQLTSHLAMLLNETLVAGPQKT